MRTLLIRILAIGLFAFLLYGCASLEPWGSQRGRAGHGPPPHAPAHGHRHKHHDGVEMVFDSGLDVYIVVGYPGYYFYDSRYYRLRDGRWEISLLLKGPWGGITQTGLPPGLRKMKGKGHRNRKHHR